MSDRQTPDPNFVLAAQVPEGTSNASGNAAAHSRKRSRIAARHLSQHVRQSVCEQFYQSRSSEYTADDTRLPVRVVSDSVDLDLHRRLLELERLQHKPIESERRSLDHLRRKA